jgi:hypothetical protein
MENFALLPHRAEAHTTVLSKSVGQCFRTCPDAEHILAGLAAQENGPKVLKVISRGWCEITGQRISLAEKLPRVADSWGY